MSHVPKIPLRRHDEVESGRAAEVHAIIAEMRALLERAEAAGLPVVAYCLVTAITKAEETIREEGQRR